MGMCLCVCRFPEAMKVVNVPITKAMKRGWKEVCWPQSKQTIEESKRDVFLVSDVEYDDCGFRKARGTSFW